MKYLKDTDIVIPADAVMLQTAEVSYTFDDVTVNVVSPEELIPGERYTAGNTQYSANYSDNQLGVSDGIHAYNMEWTSDSSVSADALAVVISNHQNSNKGTCPVASGEWK